MEDAPEYDNGKGRIINITIEGSKKEGVLRVTNEMSVGELYGLIYHKDYLHPEGGEEYILYNESDKLFMVETLLPIWSYGLRNDCKVTVVKLPNNIYGEIFKLEIKKVREMELFTKEDDKLIEITSQFQIIKKQIFEGVEKIRVGIKPDTRVIAREKTKDFGRLAVLANWRLEVNKNFNISKNSFFPKPKIDSTLLSFKPKKNNKFNLQNPKNL